jgi:hypothetical protein
MWNHCIGRCGHGRRRTSASSAQQADHAGKADQQKGQRLGKGQAQLGADEAGAPEQDEQARSQASSNGLRIVFSVIYFENQVATPQMKLQKWQQS